MVSPADISLCPEGLNSAGHLDVRIAQSVVDAMLAAATAALPREACGILLAEGGRITRFVETANVHPAPLTHFEIDPQALIDAHRAARAGGAQVAGYFHSHPHGPARPSLTDQALAAQDGAIWAIAGAPEKGRSREAQSRTSGGGQSRTSEDKGRTDAGESRASCSIDLSFWRDDKAGFAPLSYHVANG